jgi:beta-lactamase regulating signal transducer with metallopeptidase domain
MPLTSLLSMPLPGDGSTPLVLLIKATLLLLIALAATAAMRHASAGARHLVWLAALGALVVLPAVAAWSPLRVAILPPPAPVEPRVTRPIAPQTNPAATNGTATDVATPNVVPAPTVPAPSDRASVRGVLATLQAHLGLTLLAAWAIVALGFLAWLAHGMLAVRRIVRRGRVVDADPWRAPLLEVADRLALETTPRLVLSTDIQMPFACGFVEATVVLPADADAWTDERRRAVLLHELAHVRRRDLVGHTLGRLACALYWFHPLVWTAARRLRAESERACDDLALTCGARASDYAEHLLDIVSHVRNHATPAVALAMARRKEFEGRMLAILDPEMRRAEPSRLRTAGMVGGLAALCLVVAAMAPAQRSAPAAENVAVSPVDSAAQAGTSTPAQPDVRHDTTIRTAATVTRADTRTDERALERTTERTAGRTVDRDSEKSLGVDLRPSPTPLPIASAAAPAPAAAPEPRLDVRALAMGQDTTGRRAGDRAALLARILQTDTSARFRRVAAWGLANYGDSDVASRALAAALVRDNDTAVREMAAWALAGTSDRDATRALAAALRDDDARLRATAAWSLGQADHVASEDVTALATAVRDESARVRAAAAWALGNVNPKQAPAVLFTALSDSEPRVREMAAWALYEIQDPRGLRPLQAALAREQHSSLKRGIIYAIAVLGEQSTEAIEALLDAKEPGLRDVAIRALAGDAGIVWPMPWPDPRPNP